MSLIWTDSFNIVGGSWRTRYENTNVVQAIIGGRFEGNAFQLQGGGNGDLQLRSVFANDQYMAFGMNVNPATNGAWIHVYVYDGTTVQCSAKFTCNSIPGSASVVAYRGTGTTLGSATGLTYLPATWYYLDIEFFVDDSAGYIKVYIDDTLVLSVTGQDTQSTASAQGNGFGMNPGGFLQIDELYVLNGQGSVNNSRIGPKRVSSFDLSGDGNSTQWTPSTGSTNYNLVDERNGINSSDYVSTDVANDLDLYTLTAKTLPNLGFNGIDVLIAASEEGLTGRVIRAAIRSGGTNYFGSNIDLVSSVLCYPTIWETNPNTGSAFVSSGLDALEIGQELVS